MRAETRQVAANECNWVYPIVLLRALNSPQSIAMARRRRAD